MLAFANRFHGRGSIKTVLRMGSALRNDHFTLKYSLNERRKTPRFAVVVSKKVQKSAVGRNRIRRRMYELLRIELPHLKPQGDIVIIVTSPDCRQMPINDLQQLIQTTLTKAHLYKTSEK